MKGTKPKIPFRERIKIRPTTTAMGENIAVFCTPVVGESGKDFTGKVILIDQLKRKHPTDKITFTWVGSTEPPKPPKSPTPLAPPANPNKIGSGNARHPRFDRPRP